jgi:citrate lyase beta subunit
VKTTLTPTDWAAAGAPPVGPQGVVLPRQPVHTVYGGAHLFRADTVAKMGVVALGLLDRFAPDGASLADALGLALTKERADGLRARVVDKLRREPIEDYRIDFEDGFGLRSDDEESREAERSATELARAERSRTAPPQVGLRIKPLVGSTARRAAETLDRFLTTLVRELGGLPPGFVVTLPKVESESEVNRLADLLDRLEAGLELRRGVLRVELMVESTRALVDTEGRLALPRLVAAGRGRVVGAHFGTYDYTASCGVVAAHQSMGHPACGFALQVMQACLAHTGVLLSDGATNTLPIPPHRAPKSASEEAENAVRVRGAWSVARAGLLPELGPPPRSAARALRRLLRLLRAAPRTDGGAPRAVPGGGDPRDRVWTNLRRRGDRPGVAQLLLESLVEWRDDHRRARASDRPPGGRPGASLVRRAGRGPGARAR